MNYIFIDTNVFYNNWYLKSADFRYLFNYIENTNSILLMSELVVEEVENIRYRELNNIIETLLKELGKSIKLLSIPKSYDFEGLREEYNFKDLLEEKTSQIQYVPYCDIKQTEIVKRALKKIKPFQEEEKGYRDTLIWLSLISFLKEKEIKSEVIFISNNKSDFFNNKVDDFHDDLNNDIKSSGLKCKIKPYVSLFNFIASNVDKAVHEFKLSELLDEHLYTIESELEYESIDFINHISTSQIKEILKNNQLRTFPYIETLVEHSIELIEGIEDPEILHYKKISNDAIYVSYRYYLRISVLNLTISSSEYLNAKSQVDRSYQDIYSDESFTSYSVYVKTYLDVSFEYNLTTKVIVGFNIETIDFK